MNWLAVFVGGGIGSLARYGISRYLGHHGSGFPTGTFVANVLACVILALGWMYLQDKWEASAQVRALVLVGFCGGFSTFSTFSLETFQLLEAGQWGMAIGYVLGSVLVCLLVMAAIIHR